MIYTLSGILGSIWRFVLKKKLSIVIGLCLVLALVAWFARPLLSMWVAQQNRFLITDENAQQVVDRIASWEKYLGPSGMGEVVRAEAYRKLNDPKQVKRHVEKALAMGVDEKIANQPLWLQMAEGGLLEEPQKHLAQMLQSYRGKEHEVYDAFLLGYTGSWRLGDANKMMKQWREQFPEEARTYYWEGAILGLDYQIATATEKYRKAVTMDPELWEARLRMAELLIEQSKLPEAEEHFAILYKKIPDNLNVRIGYARCLMNQGYSENALKLLETLDEKSTDSPLLFLKCQAAFEANENTKAEKWLEVLCKRWPEVAPYRDLQARVKESLQKGEEATPIFKIASESQAKQQEISQLISSLDGSPGNISIRVQLGEKMMYYLSPEAGSAQLLSAISLEPSAIEPHQLLIDYYRREGKPMMIRQHQAVVDRLAASSQPTSPSP